MTPSSPSLLDRVRALSGSLQDRRAFLDEAIAILHDARPAHSWTGIYLRVGEDLLLSTFQGPPTPHHRIRVGTEGICGDVAQTGVSEIIPDVNSDPRYLCCSVSVKSELVVPIRKGDAVLGVVDIDSHDPDAFTETDREEVEAFADLVAERL
jgi:GAF domain-containing protein